jgi:hypothetical protein
MDIGTSREKLFFKYTQWERNKIDIYIKIFQKRSDLPFVVIQMTKINLHIMSELQQDCPIDDSHVVDQIWFVWITPSIPECRSLPTNMSPHQRRKSGMDILLIVHQSSKGYRKPIQGISCHIHILTCLIFYEYILMPFSLKQFLMLETETYLEKLRLGSN